MQGFGYRGAAAAAMGATEDTSAGEEIMQRSSGHVGVHLFLSECNLAPGATLSAVAWSGLIRPCGRNLPDVRSSKESPGLPFHVL